jgi:hypothetical protein
VGGGGYFELKNTEDLGAAFARVAEELHHQYLLAFTPEIHDGEVHTIDVRVRGSDLTARARTSYVAPLADRPSSSGLDTAIARPAAPRP